MVKIGRNQPCPCGSGKKYKRCCGSLAVEQPRQNVGVGMSTQTRLTHLNAGQAGLPGQAQKIIVVMQYRDPNDPRNLGGPRGLPGQYRVTFVLSRPGIPLTPENQYSFASGLRGDSHLAVTRPAFLPPGNPDADRLLINGISPDGQFQFTGLPNERGFLGKIVSEPFNANGFSDAELKAYRALVPTLSNWSVHSRRPTSR